MSLWVTFSLSLSHHKMADYRQQFFIILYYINIVFIIVSSSDQEQCFKLYVAVYHTCCAVFTQHPCHHRPDPSSEATVLGLPPLSGPPPHMSFSSASQVEAIHCSPFNSPLCSSHILYTCTSPSLNKDDGPPIGTSFK